MLELALNYAKRGACVFPCTPAQKAPYLKGGFKSATKDPKTIQSWWEQHPTAMVGMPTGDITGIFVLDVDEHGKVSGNSSLADLETKHGKLPETLEALTPSGGRHLYFKNVSSLKCSAGVVGPGLDIRANGGYIIAPGSINSDGKQYLWVNTNLKPAIAPDWLVDLATKKKRAIQVADLYAKKAQQKAVTTLLAASEGNRNDVLNKQAFGLFGLVKANRLDESKVRQILTTAAQGIGLDVDEIEKTLDSAFDAAEPRHDGLKKAEKKGASNAASDLSLDDFRAHMPDHRYIFIPSRDMWPSSSVDARVPWPKDSEGNSIRASNWLDSNAAVEQMTWAPGLGIEIKDKLIDTGGWINQKGCTCFNLYRPPTIKHGDPKKAGKWIDHVRTVYPRDADHIINWSAHRLQRPQEKINHALVLGGKPGIGKDTLLEPVKQAVGAWNCQEIAPNAMLGRFNGFVKSVILRVSEARDLGDVDRYAFYDHMKTIIAAPPDVIRVDEKHLREYPVPNVCGVIITTNYKTNGLYLPEDDRRHYVAWSDLVENPFDEKYWEGLWHWYYQGGFEHVAAYLAHRDLSVFNPKAPPLKTEAFWHMVNSNRAPEDEELADILDALSWPKAVTLENIKATARRMGYQGFAEWLDERKNRRKIPHRMEAAGYESVNNSSRKDGIWIVNGKRQNIYSSTKLSIRDRIAAATQLT